MQAGPSSTRSVRPATAASSVNASRRRLTNSASPHQTESITGHASTASASARRSRAPHELARGARCRVGKHLHPFIVNWLALELLHPHRHLDDVLDRGAAGLD